LASAMGIALLGCHENAEIILVGHYEFKPFA